MKKFSLSLLFTLSSFLCFSQNSYEFSLVTCYEKFNWLTFEFYVVARVEYDKKTIFIQEDSLAQYPESRREAFKKAKKFESVIDVFNYMSEQKWEYVQAVLISEPVSNQLVYRWLLKRKKS